MSKKDREIFPITEIKIFQTASYRFYGSFYIISFKMNLFKFMNLLSISQIRIFFAITAILDFNILDTFAHENYFVTFMDFIKLLH